MTLFEIALFGCAAAFALSAPFLFDTRRAGNPRRLPATARGAEGRRVQDKLTDIQSWAP